MEEEEVKVQPLSEREVDRERVRRLISRVSSVIEMRKMSTASLASTSDGSSATNSMVSDSPAERNGYKVSTELFYASKFSPEVHLCFFVLRSYL